MACPVYLFTGFLDSGKTSLIKDTLSDTGFMEEGARTLVLCFEQGEEGYSEEFLQEHGAFIEYFDSIDDFTVEKIHDLDSIYHPDQVFIEYNGTIPVCEMLISGMPAFWPLVQILTTIDATTFDLYIKSMRSFLYEQLRYSDTVIVNRCTEDTDASLLRGNIKAINRRAIIFYEGFNGEGVNLKGGLLPFNIDDPIINIQDDDYGLWYMDALEEPEKYNEKEIILRGMYADDIPGYTQSFILGRRALVCCEQDTSLCGITVTGVKIEEMKKGDWVEIQGTLKTVPVEDSGVTLVLYANRAQHCDKPIDEYVTFS